MFFSKFLKQFRLQKKSQLVIAMKSLENIPDSVFWVDNKSRIIYVNDAACKELGYEKSELTEMTVFEIDGSKEYAAPEGYEKLSARIRNHEISHFSTYHKHADGHLIPVEIVSASVKVEDEELGVSIARDISERIKLENEITTAYSKLSVLYNIYRLEDAHHDKLDLHFLLNKTIELLYNELDISGIAYCIYDTASKILVINNSLGLEKEFLEKISILHQNKIKAETLDNFEPFNPNEFMIDATIKQLFVAARLNCTFFPIIVNKNFFGGICMISDFDQPLSSQNHELVFAVCSQLGTMISNIQLNDSLADELEKHKRTGEILKHVNSELEQSAYLDQLTNVWNRRYLLNNVDAQIDFIKTHQSHISLLLIDIDHFKRINDQFGHQVGDRVLIEFANLLKNEIRSGDILARWGGEEFIILAPHLDSQEAVQYAERLRKLVAVHEFQIIKSMTVSIGIAELTENETLDSWTKRVDDALYSAKGMNRNTVMLSQV